MKDKPGNKPLSTMEDLFFLVPRGKYSITFYEEYLKLHGKTFTYCIQYHNVSKVFQLYKEPDAGDFVIIVVQLLKPIKQGQTLHPFLVL